MNQLAKPQDRDHVQSDQRGQGRPHDGRAARRGCCQFRDQFVDAVQRGFERLADGVQHPVQGARDPGAASVTSPWKR